MKRTIVTIIAVSLSLSLGFLGCSDDDGGGGGNGDDGGGTATATDGDDDTGTVDGDDDTGTVDGDGDTGQTDGDEDTGTVDGEDTYNGGNGDADGGNGGVDDYVWHWGDECPGDASSAPNVITVGTTGTEYTTTAGEGENGNITVAPGDWIYFTWAGGPHTVTATTWEGDDVASQCSSDNDRPDWFGSGEQSDGYGCLQINNVEEEERFWYKCAVGEHCQNGMYAWIDVVPE